jgi:uncharacterized protein (DUF2141 family)
MKKLLLVFLLLSANTLIAEPNSGLTIVINKLIPKLGCLNLAMYKDVSGYNDGNINKAYIVLKQKVEKSTMKIFIPDLIRGNYGVKTFQDKDCTGRMKKGWFGVPKYAYGFSNNTRSRTFINASFQYDKNHNKQIINLKKFSI